MSLPKKGFIEIFDPRIGENFEIENCTGEKISSLKHELMVIRLYPGRNNSHSQYNFANPEINHFIKQSMLNAGGKGFFSISPLNNKVSARINIDATVLNSGIGYFDLDDTSIKSILNARLELISFEEWSIGCCINKFEEPVKNIKWYNKAVYWDLGYVFSQINNVNCCSVFFGETGESIFIARLYEDLDKFLDPLKKL